jgi:tRNA 2-thiouridine synthesizing protein A
VIVDARGLRCPWPAIRLARAMRETADVVIVADDAAAPREIAALCTERGWNCAPAETPIGDGFRVIDPNQS